MSEPYAPQQHPLVKLVDERIKRKDKKMRGLAIPSGAGTFFSELSMGPFDSAITTTIDIQLQGDRSQADKSVSLPAILSRVPVSSNNRGYGFVRYTQMPCELAKSESGKVEITGLSKRGPGLSARRFEVSPVSGVIIPGSETVIGLQIWPIEYGDIVTAGGYGVVPYGSMGMYDGVGGFVRLIG